MSQTSLQHQVIQPPIQSKPECRNDPVLLAEQVRIQGNGSFSLSLQSLRIDEGESVALVGANGAGKTTLLAAIAGAQGRATGRGSLLGVAFKDWPKAHDKHRLLGVQLQNLAFHPGVYVGELVGIHRTIYGSSAPELLTLLGLEELRGRLYGVLSQGQRRRVNIFLAAAHQPRLLVLDEPTAALDEKFRLAVRSMIGTHTHQRGGAVFFATHLATDLPLADRIIWLNHGRIEATGTLASHLDRYLAPFKGVLDFHVPADPSVKDMVRRVAKVAFFPSPTRITLFGDEPVQAEFQRCAAHPDVKAYSFGRTTAQDFLAFTSGAYQ